MQVRQSPTFAMSEDDVQLNAHAVMLLTHLRRPGQTQDYYRDAVESALYRLERTLPGRFTRSGWVDVLFAAMERRVENGPRGGRQDKRDWWASKGKAAMRAHVERVRAEGES